MIEFRIMLGHRWAWAVAIASVLILQIGSFGIANFLPNAEAVPSWQLIYTADDLPENSGFPFYSPAYDDGCTPETQDKHREIHTGGFYHYKSTIAEGCLQRALVWNADHNTGFTVEGRIKINSVNMIGDEFRGVAVTAESSVKGAILIITTNDIKEYIDGQLTGNKFVMNTVGSFHDYRIVVQGETYTFYVDGIQSLTGPASTFGRNEMWWGDSTAGGAHDAEFDCVAYTTGGAFSPTDLPSPSCGTPNCTEPPSGMVSWWDGDAVSGTTVFDIQDANDGTMVGDTTIVTGKVGQAFSFDGADDYVEIPHDTSLNLNAFSVDAWVFIDPAQNANEGNMLVSKTSGTTLDGGFWLLHDDRKLGFVLAKTTNSLRFAANGGLNAHEAFISNAFPTAGFYHIAGTFDGSNSLVYVNGVPSTTFDGSPGPVLFNQLSLRIGAAHAKETFGIDDRFKGLIDEVEIYDRALSASEIQDIFNAGIAGKCKDFFDVEKFYTETNVNWNPNIDNDGDGLINEDPVNNMNDDNDCTDGTSIFVGNPTDNVDDPCSDATNTLKPGMSELIDEDDVDAIRFGTTLPIDSGKFLLQAVMKKDGTVSNYNPGQYYAVTKVTVKQDLDNLWIEELFGDCTDRANGINLSIVNPNKVPGGAAVVVVDPLGAVTDRSDELAASGALFLTDTNGTPNDVSDDNGITDNAELHLEESIPKDSMVYLYVKLAPGLKGQPLPSDPDNMCHNEEIVSTMIDDNIIEEIAEADLIVKAK